MRKMQAQSAANDLPPLAPFPPRAPPSIPSPPSPPISGLCTNTCDSTGGQLNMCNDDGTLCDYGTDCLDCGIRLFCTGCPDDCKARAYADPDNACFEAYWNEVGCQDGCNNAECGHNGCTVTQAVQKCIPEQDLLGSTAGSPNTTGLVMMNLQLELEAVRLELDEQINELVLTQELEFSLQWEDERLEDAPCREILSGLLSLTTEEGQNDQARYEKIRYWERFWIPEVEAAGLSPGSDPLVDRARFSFTKVGTWQEGFAPSRAADPSAAAEARERRLASAQKEGADASGVSSGVARRRRRSRRRPQAKRRISESDAMAAPCTNCVLWNGEMEFPVLQGFKYDLFPFDSHTIRLELTVLGANLFTCSGSGAAAQALQAMELTEENAQSLLLPQTNTWRLDGRLEDAVTLRHPSEDGEPRLDSCLLEIRIRRNSNVYFVKQLLTTLLVTSGGLLALLMHPEEMIGDRCAQLLVAVLILITSLQTDLGLGKLSYLIWVDYFNLVQLVLLILALAQTMIIHRLQHNQLRELVVIVDRVFRTLIPLLLYPFIVVGMILYGLEHTHAGVVFFSGGILLTLVAGGLWVNRAYLRAKRNRSAAIRDTRELQAQALPPEDEKTLAAVKVLFEAYDLDGSGDVDAREMRQLLSALFTDAPRHAIAHAMHEVQRIASADETLDLNSFIDAYQAATRAIKEVAGTVLPNGQDDRHAEGSLVHAAAATIRKATGIRAHAMFSTAGRDGDASEPKNATSRAGCCVTVADLPLTPNRGASGVSAYRSQYGALARAEEAAGSVDVALGSPGDEPAEGDHSQHQSPSTNAPHSAQRRRRKGSSRHPAQQSAPC